MDGEESFNGLLWYRENEGKVTCMNADSVPRVVNVDTCGTAVKMIYGRSKNVCIENERLSVMLEPGEMTLLELAETPWLGIYDGEIYIDKLQNGTYTVRGTDGKKVAVALYKDDDNQKELVSFCVAEEGASVSVSDEIGRVKLLKWNGFHPVACVVLERLSEASK